MALYVLGGVLALLLLAAIGLRLYFSDARLCAMAESTLSARLGTEVKLERLEVSLLSGVELGPMRVAAMPGFSQETVALSRLALHWSALDLLRLRLIIKEMALEGVRLTVEENDSGSNLDAVTRAFKGPAEGSESAPAEPPAPEPAAREPIVQPSLPVRVELEKLLVSVDEVRVLRPDLQASIDHIGVGGRFAGEGRAIELLLSVWLGEGNAAELTGPSRLSVAGRALDGRAVIEQQLAITLASTGLADIDLGVHWNAETRVEGGPPLPPLRLAGDVEVTTDLLRQTLSLARCQWSVGERTSLAVRAAAEGLLGRPSLRVDELAVRSDLGELAALVAAFVPGAKLAGTLSVEAEPFQVPADPQQLHALEARLRLALEGLSVALPGSTAEGLDLHATLATGAESATLHLETKLARAVASGQEAAGLETVIDVATPLAPWLGGAPVGSVDIKAQVAADRAGSDAGRARALDLTFSAAAPVAMLKKQPSPEPLVASVRMRLGRVEAPQAALRGLDVQLAAKAWDLAGERVQADLVTRIADVTTRLGEEDLRLAGTQLDVGLYRAGQHIELRRLRFATAETLEVELAGAFDQVLTAAPRLSDVSLRIGPVELARALALLPASRRPPIDLSGRFGVTARVHGTVPYRELMRHAQVPQLAPGADPAQATQQLADFIQSWSSLFERGLPFVADVALTLDGVAANDQTLDLEGLSLALHMALEKHRPSLRLDLDVAEVRRPSPVGGVHADLSFALADGSFSFGLNAKAARAGGAQLLHLADDAGFGIAVRYHMGGDLLLERLVVEAPHRGVRVEASGVVSKPLQLALARGWEQPGLPGVEAALRWSLGMDAGELAPVMQGGPELGGSVGLAGMLQASKGLVSLEGSFTTEHLHVRSGATELEDMSGELPFDVAVAFDPRPDVTILRRHLSVGSGVLGVVTGGEESANRAARPAYYDRLRSYRQRVGLTARMLRNGSHELANFELEGRITQGMLLADRVAMHVLGGDIAGNLAVGVQRDASGRALPRFQLAVKASNIDASYFKELDLKPGPQSELSADLQLGVMLAPRRRELSLNMNVTKIGTETFDRFLQLLDPKGTDENLQDTRSKLGWVRIDNVAAWVRHEQFNMDLAVTTRARIPYTQLGFPNIDRELVRRFPLGDRLNDILGPLTANVLAPMLGWRDAG